MTSSEQRTWEALRLLREHGVHATRQHEIGRYRVDFAIRKVRVAIEVDGGIHDLPGHAEADALRQAYIEAKGWRVVRIRAEQTHDTKTIIDAVKAALPLPLRGGGGGLGEPPASEGERSIAAKNPKAGGSPNPLTPSPQGEGDIPAHLRRRTRASRKLPPRRKT